MSPLTQIIEALRSTTLSTLRETFDTQAPCALIGFNEYANVGDHAIWLGERALLRQLGVSIVYAASASTFSATGLRARLKRGTILLQGGGNFGDLWGLQPFRERIIADFPDYPIVQLPQSICFLDAKNLDRCKTVMSGHPDVRLLVRDSQSLALAQEHFAAPARLCPDMAIGLGMVRSRRRPVMDVLWLYRDDRESSQPFDIQLGPGQRVRDWVGPEGRFARRASFALLRAADRVSVTAAGTQRLRLSLFDAMAHWRVRFGLQLLQRAKLVVSNRLHGHILCALLDKPHVILPDRYGKIASFYGVWTSGLENAHFTRSLAQAANAVASYLSGERLKGGESGPLS